MSDLLDPLQATVEEAQAIRALKRLAKRWPKSLWLFSANGTLNVMKTDEDGGKIHLPGTGTGIDPAYALDVIDIQNDGGDW